jgi:LytS/YehU family sensor histidine kinase
MLRLSYTWMVLLAWSYGYLWVRTELALRAESRFARRARREAYRMELNLLRSQLDPHFLFNSLNGISAEIRPHPEAAVNMVNELADYLRYSLDHRKQALATLGEEVAAMTAYLKIEHARFGDALRFEVELAPAAAACRVPSFLLQPLVENAVKHGFDPEKGPMLLRINAQICGLFLTIEVANNGQLGSAQARSGVGLDNLRRRLDLHYPRRHSFSLSEIGGEVIARLELEGPPCSA